MLHVILTETTKIDQINYVLVVPVSLHSFWSVHGGPPTLLSIGIYICLEESRTFRLCCICLSSEETKIHHKKQSCALCWEMFKSQSKAFPLVTLYSINSSKSLVIVYITLCLGLSNAANYWLLVDIKHEIMSPSRLINSLEALAVLKLYLFRKIVTPSYLPKRCVFSF